MSDVGNKKNARAVFDRFIKDSDDMWNASGYATYSAGIMKITNGHNFTVYKYPLNDIKRSEEFYSFRAFIPEGTDTFKLRRTISDDLKRAENDRDARQIMDEWERKLTDIDQNGGNSAN